MGVFGRLGNTATGGVFVPPGVSLAVFAVTAGLAGEIVKNPGMS